MCLSAPCAHSKQPSMSCLFAGRVHTSSWSTVSNTGAQLCPFSSPSPLFGLERQTVSDFDPLQSLHLIMLTSKAQPKLALANRCPAALPVQRLCVFCSAAPGHWAQRAKACCWNLSWCWHRWGGDWATVAAVRFSGCPGRASPGAGAGVCGGRGCRNACVPCGWGWLGLRTVVRAEAPQQASDASLDTLPLLCAAFIEALAQAPPLGSAQLLT